MGIHYFYAWVSKKYSKCIRKYRKYKQIEEKVDILAFDLNSIIHGSAQKVFGYGNYDFPLSEEPTILKIYKDVVYEIDKMVKMVNPREEILICIDGVAGLAKIFQQRQRRFKSSIDRSSSFDSTSISPGTEFLNGLSKYIITFLKKKTEWEAPLVIFSSDRVPGEGEEKCFRYFRTKPNKRCLIYGSDADLIMYSLLCPADTLILRDNHYNTSETFLVNMDQFKNILTNEIKISYKDFVFVCFLIGNDFLPIIPNIEVFDGGIEELFKIYNTNFKKYGNLINDNFEFNRKAVKKFFIELSKLEQLWLDRKIFSNNHFGDLSINESKGDLQTYKKLYYKNKFKVAMTIDSRVKISKDYLIGMQWVLKYYTSGMPDWNWYYPYQYSPFISDLILGITEMSEIKFKSSKPLLPFQQLLLILPPPSKYLLPFPLNKLLDSDSPIKEYYPDDFEIDLSGKRKEWQGIPILPEINIKRVMKEYARLYPEISDIDLNRSRPGKVLAFRK